MKKYVQNFWVRFLACLLCTVTLLTGAVMGILIAVTSVGSKEELYENKKAIIAENYAGYIYTHLEDEKKIDEFLKDKNFSCSVTKLEKAETVSKTEGIRVENHTVLYNNLSDASDWDYSFEIKEGAYVQYDIDSIWNALRVESIILGEVEYTQTAITGYVLDTENGVFYYQTESGYYFPAEYIIVSDGNVYYDYILDEQKDGYEYYNRYYKRKLDTSEYEQWEWVKINDETLRISASPSKTAIGILEEDGSLQEQIFRSDLFYEAGESIFYYSEEKADRYVIQIKVDDLTHSERLSEDMFSEWKEMHGSLFNNKTAYEIVLVLMILIFICSFALLIYSAKEEKEELGTWNKLPVLTFSFGVLGLEILGGLLMMSLLEEAFGGYVWLSYDAFLILLFLLAFAMLFVGVFWLQNIITRFKTKTFLRYSEFHYVKVMITYLWKTIMKPVHFFVNMARQNTTLFVRGTTLLCVISFAEIFAYVFFCCIHWMELFYFILLVIVKAAEAVGILFILMQMQKLQEGSKRIAAGDLSEPIDTNKMIWEFKKHGENINKVSDGIALAVEERMKSERFKTELITNVSHDIKTPLTSIINYVDLIKKQEIQDETLQEYLDVLERQSARLKKLIEDLMEASKASTGNLPVTMEDCDVEVLLIQLIGEFEEKLSASELEVVVQKPDHPVIITADGRYVWRVFDNLLNNACKYSMPRTRVYISLTETQGEVMITFKNISKAALNIPSDELLERFVRGDSSRNTEGSGLGLSIAQSLTELMKGSMKLEIDGDLFKVILKFVVKSN